MRLKGNGRWVNSAGPWQYTDTSAGFAVGPESLAAHEVGRACRGQPGSGGSPGTDPVAPSGARPRPVSGPARSAAGAAGAVRQATLTVRPATAVAPATPRPGRRARGPRSPPATPGRRPRDPALEATGFSADVRTLSCQRCCGVSNANSRALISDTVASVSSGNRGARACRQCARDMRARRCSDRPADRVRAGARRTGEDGRAPAPCGASPRRGSKRRP